MTMIPDSSAPQPLLTRLDDWVSSNPWHPRVLPFVVYVAGFMLIGLAMSLSLWSYPPLYVLQCALVAYLLWRYRRLVPELTLKFHWLAIPVGLGMTVAWVELGSSLVSWWPERFDYLKGQPHEMEEMRAVSPVLFWSSLIVRLFGMSLLVPLFEELFIRSAVLRGLHRFRPTMVGATQVLLDMPVIGEWLEETEMGRKAAAAPPQLTKQLIQTPVGHITVFAVFASTLVFALSHALRDWPGCFACGIAWCLLLWWTNRPALPPERRLGLGPVVWSHGICNATLWYYCVTTGDWQWL